MKSYEPYSPEIRQAARAWLLEHWVSLYVNGTSMRQAAQFFTENTGHRASGHFLGRVAAKLREAGLIEYHGSGRKLTEACWRESTPAEWVRLEGAVRLVMWRWAPKRADKLSDAFVARVIREGIIENGRRVLCPILWVSIEAVARLRRVARM